MPSPPIAVFLTTIASQPALRQRQEYILRILQVKRIPFVSYDLASDEDAKRLWRRKAPIDKQQLPGILVGNRFPGTFTDFEEAVEFDELTRFLRLDETWDENEEQPLPVQKPIGVPGASSPLQMTPEHLRAKIFAQPQSPLAGRGKNISAKSGGSKDGGGSKDLPINNKNDFDVSTELEGYGLQGVRVTEDELRDLVAELGLGDDDAGDLVRGLSDYGSPAERKAEDKVENKVDDHAESEKSEVKGIETKKEEDAKEKGN